MNKVDESLQDKDKRIKELEEDNKELTNYYDKNKDYEHKYNVCINRMEEIRVNMWSEIHHRTIAEYKLNAIREVVEDNLDCNTTELKIKYIKQILEESK